MVTYSRRVAHKRKPLSAEFMYLLVVVAAAMATAWWAGHLAGMNLSAIKTAASVLGINETVGTTRQVGYSLAHAQGAQAGGTAAVAPYCEAGQAPAFANGLAALKLQIGNVMGTPIECEHATSGFGNTVQQTSTGLAAYNSQTNTDTFTDGWHHWAMTPQGLVTWEGTEADPPRPSPTADAAPTGGMPAR